MGKGGKKNIHPCHKIFQNAVFVLLFFLHINSVKQNNPKKKKGKVVQ